MIVGYLYNIGNMWDTYAEKNVQWYTMIIIGMIMIGIYDILLGYVIVEKMGEWYLLETHREDYHIGGTPVRLLSWLK